MKIEKIDVGGGLNIDRGEIWFNDAIRISTVDLDKKIPRPDTIISIGEYTYGQSILPIDVMTAGEFSIIAAPSKSKKSYLKSAFAASFIGGNSNNHFENIKGHRKDDSECVLDFDTEQSEYYAQRAFKNVERIVGARYKNYYPFRLRRMSADERMSFIERYLKVNQFKKNIRLVFVDGIADLVNDSNDLVMSNDVVERIMTLTDIYNIHICVIIHTAYGTQKPTGHLGSASVKKCESLLSINAMDDYKKVMEVSNPFSRGYGFDPFCFEIKNGLPQETFDSGSNTLSI